MREGHEDEGLLRIEDDTFTLSAISKPVRYVVTRGLSFSKLSEAIDAMHAKYRKI